MLNNGTEELFGTPEFIYKNVSTEYQAGFFGEANLLPKNLLTSTETSENTIVFPHQLKISEEKTQIEVTIKRCYFKGTHFLVEADFNGKIVFFNNSFPLGKR